MTAVRTYRHGAFCWADLGVAAPDEAALFYARLFELGVAQVPNGAGGTYTLLRKEGRDVAGIYAMHPRQAELGVPAYWQLYVAVDDVDAAAGRVVPAGGRVVVAPFEVPGSGRMAVVEDPSGGYLALWQGREHAGAGALAEPSAMCWWELASRDAAAAGRFYAAVFGWRCEDRELAATRYTTFFAGDEAVGGMLQMTPEWGDVPTHWMAYFVVEGCDASAARAGELGGEVCVPPTDIPPIGRFAVVRDPQGAAFSIIQMAGAGG